MSEEQDVSHITTVTSENLAEFNARGLGLSAEATAEDAQQEELQGDADPEISALDDDAGDDDTSAQERQQEDSTKPKKEIPKIQKRFSELTGQRDAARAEAQKEREARIALEARMKALEERDNPKVEQAKDDGRPRPEHFTDAFEYAEALAEYKVNKAIADRDAKEAQARQEAQQKALADSWQQRQQAAMEEFPDYREVLEASDIVVSNEVQAAILESDVGPKIAYHLATHPDVADKLTKMSTISALREIGKIEARYEKPEPEQKRQVQHKAPPEPINPIRGGSGVTENKVNSKGEFTGSYADYKAMRAAGKIR